VLSQVIGKWRSLGRNEKFLFSSGLPFSTDQERTLINPQLVLIPQVPQLMKHVDPRIVIGIGFALFAASNFLNISMTNDYAADQLLSPNVVRAVG